MPVIEKRLDFLFVILKQLTMFLEKGASFLLNGIPTFWRATVVAGLLQTFYCTCKSGSSMGIPFLAQFNYCYYFIIILFYFFFEKKKVLISSICFQHHDKSLLVVKYGKQTFNILFSRRRLICFGPLQGHYRSTNSGGKEFL